MAVSKLGNGICVAGIRDYPNGYAWIRPTREKNPGWRQLEKADLIGYRGHPNQELTKIGNVVQWEITDKMEDVGSHIEDYCHPTVGAKVLTKQLSPKEFLQFIAEREESEAADFPNYLDDQFSLIVIRPIRILHIYMDTTNIKGKHQPKIQFEYANDSFNYPVTDLIWYKFSSDCKRNGTFLNGSYKDLSNAFALKIEYLVLGSSWYKGKYWHFIVGVICDKPIQAIN